MKKIPLVMLNWILCTLYCFSIKADTPNKCLSEDFITIAILAKDKESVLPLYLECIEQQTWPKKQTYLYIRTNNNNDNTAQIIEKWIEKVKDHYAEIYFDKSNVPEQVQNYKPHEWNYTRFKVLGKIRQDSVNWAKQHNSHYFVVDCDNFIFPHTLSKLFEVHLPIIAPFLKISDQQFYSNFHSAVDENGYLESDPSYYQIFAQIIKGLIQVPVVHCSYLIRQEVLDKMSYDDDSGRYEYVIFSDTARKNDISQYFDNRELYGRLTFAENKEELLQETWLNDFAHLKVGAQLIQEQKERGEKALVPSTEEVDENKEELVP